MIGIIFAVIITAVGLSSPAHAALDLSGISVDITDYILIATFLITALVAFWGIRKGMGLLNHVSYVQLDFRKK